MVDLGAGDTECRCCCIAWREHDRDAFGKAEQPLSARGGGSDDLTGAVGEPRKQRQFDPGSQGDLRRPTPSAGIEKARRRGGGQIAPHACAEHEGEVGGGAEADAVRAGHDLGLLPCEAPEHRRATAGIHRIAGDRVPVVALAPELGTDLLGIC